MGFAADTFPIGWHVRKPEGALGVSACKRLDEMHGHAADQAAALQFQPRGVQYQCADPSGITVRPQGSYEAAQAVGQHMDGWWRRVSGALGYVAFNGGQRNVQVFVVDGKVSCVSRSLPG